MELRERIAAVRPAQQQEIVEDAFSEVRDRVHSALIADLGPQLATTDLEPQVLRERVRIQVRARLAEERGLSVVDRERLVEEITDDTLGHGPIEKLLADDSVTEIMVNGPLDVWIERGGRLHPTTVRFNDHAHVRRIITKIAGQVGRRVDEASPMLDARLPDGSRVNAVLPPLSLSGPLLTIRKFQRERFRLTDMIRLASLTHDAADLLRACLRGELNILVSGGTGSGKTTLLNAMSAEIADHDRIITIEDAAELRLDQRHVLRLEARPANIEGEGEVAIRDLVRNALRMRPDRIIVGEVRGAEALDMLQAMNTGHDGSLSTVHANSARDALSRVETMVLMAGYDLPMRAIRQQIASAVDLIVHVERLSDGTRRVTAITEVMRIEGDVITTGDLFAFRVDDVASDGKVSGALRWTGLRPTFVSKLERRGIKLPATLAGPVPDAPDLTARAAVR
jgi:pilus assembly protein CpaF